ncbi:MAG: hypothetical protein NZL87_05410 [Thermomicrobium sp.]|nr:hypothetical protein [Thermomicrobium sp.]
METLDRFAELLIDVIVWVCTIWGAWDLTGKFVAYIERLECPTISEDC